MDVTRKIESFPRQTPPDHEGTLTNPRRLAALTATGLLDTGHEDAFDRAVRLATRLIGAPVGLLSLVDGRRQFFKAHTGLPVEAAARRESDLSHSFCQYVVTTDRPLAVADARKHELLRHNLAVPDLGVIAYLGVPVHAPDGETLGSFCAIDTKPRDWTDGDLEALADVAAFLEDVIALREAARVRQILVMELNHRVKNIFSMVGGMIGLSSRTAGTATELASSLRSRLVALSKAHDLVLSSGGDGYGSAATLQTIVATLIEPHQKTESAQCVIEGPAIHLGGSGTTNLALALHEMATNAAKYGALGDPEGTLRVCWTVEDETSDPDVDRRDDGLRSRRRLRGRLWIDPDRHGRARKPRRRRPAREKAGRLRLHPPSSYGIADRSLNVHAGYLNDV